MSERQYVCLTRQYGIRLSVRAADKNIAVMVQRVIQEGGCVLHSLAMAVSFVYDMEI